MIEINFAPLQLRKKKKAQILLRGLNMPLEVIIGLGGGLIILLVLVHLVLLLVNATQLAEHRRQKKEWETLQASKKEVDSVLHELRVLQGKYKAVESLVKSDKIFWSQKLNILSDSLPRGVWLNKIVFNEDVLLIEGSAVSKEREEMINVHSLTTNLRQDKKFLEDLTDLELGSIQRRKLNKTEIADFTITTKLK